MLVKPDGVKRGLVGEIIRRIEQRNLKIIALAMVEPGREQFDTHYPKDPAWIRRVGEKTLATYQKYGYDALVELGTDKPEEIGPMVRMWLLDFMTSGPVVKMVVEGVHAIDMVRKIAGNTMPSSAEMGTIRGHPQTATSAQYIILFTPPKRQKKLRTKSSFGLVKASFMVTSGQKKI